MRRLDPLNYKIIIIIIVIVKIVFIVISSSSSSGGVGVGVVGVVIIVIIIRKVLNSLGRYVGGSPRLEARQLLSSSLCPCSVSRSRPTAGSNTTPGCPAVPAKKERERLLL